MIDEDTSMEMRWPPESTIRGLKRIIMSKLDARISISPEAA